jgi:hypothetical protein
MPIAPLRYFDQRNLKKDPRSHTAGDHEKMGPIACCAAKRSKKCKKEQKANENSRAAKLLYGFDRLHGRKAAAGCLEPAAVGSRSG